MLPGPLVGVAKSVIGSHLGWRSGRAEGVRFIRGRVSVGPTDPGGSETEVSVSRGTVSWANGVRFKARGTSWAYAPRAANYSADVRGMSQRSRRKRKP